MTRHKSPGLWWGLGLVVAGCLLFMFCSPEQAKQAAPKMNPAPQVQATHVVGKGEFLRSIAPRYGVGWEQVLLVNEKFLQTKYEEVCKKFHDTLDRERDKARKIRSTKRRANSLKGIVAKERRTLFCNDRYNRPYGNTLLPSWELIIPAKQAPKQISQTVQSIPGERIALVIDDTGSMQDDREFVASYYAGAIRQYGKQLTGVFLYADGEVRKYADTGSVEFRQTGNQENTYEALKDASKDSPEAIILITDEPGDDWPWTLFGAGLPPVYGHCLPDQGQYLCEEPLKRLAKKTGGKYVPHTP